MNNQTTTTTKRTMKNPSKWEGKKISRAKWTIPEGYQVCAWTGKLYREEKLMITFSDWRLSNEFLAENHIAVCDADWLSDEGFREIMDILKAAGMYDNYVEGIAA